MRKKIYALILLLFVGWGVLHAQTAVNFTCPDCTGTTYDLFTQLDSGKVVVICWVMPCAACIGPSLTTHNVVQSFQATHPGKVILYVADDYANTSCASLRAWSLNYGISNAVFFSNASIRMSDYGDDGMPKIVVLGPQRRVYFNQNNTVNASALQDSILAAINAPATGIQGYGERIPLPAVYPNPARQQAYLEVLLTQPSPLDVTVFDASGRQISSQTHSFLLPGTNTLPLEISHIAGGMYIVRIRVENKTHNIKLLINNDK